MPNKLPSHFYTGSEFGELYDTRLAGWYSRPAVRSVYSYHYGTLDTVAKLKASLRAGQFCFPGGYPIAYLTSCGSTLCAHCVRKNLSSVISAIKDNRSDGWKVVALFVDYGESSCEYHHTGSECEEGHYEYCENCNKLTDNSGDKS